MRVNLSSPLSHAHQRSSNLQYLRKRAQDLYRNGRDLAQNHPIVRSAFAELSTALELLQARDQEYQQHQDTWLNERADLEADVRRYQEFFTLAPLPYVVTSLDGTIQQVNRAATNLFSTSEKLLIGRSLALFVPEGQRRAFRSSLAQVQGVKEVYTGTICLHPWEGTPLHVAFAVVVARSQDGKPQNLRWQIYASDPR